MTKKAGRLHSADLTTALGQAGDLAKARIVQLDATALEAVAGGTGPLDGLNDGTIVIGIPGIDDVVLDGMAPRDPEPFGDSVDDYFS